MLGLGSPELIMLLVIVLLLFGGAKVPQLMRGLGEGMREFRKATHDGDPDNETQKSISSSEKSSPQGSDKNV